MRDDRISITEMFRPFVDSKQQFLGLGEAWVEFLSYLKKRRGADIRTFRRMEEIDRAMSYVADALLDEGNADEVDREWFSQFPAASRNPRTLLRLCAALSRARVSAR